MVYIFVFCALIGWGVYSLFMFIFGSSKESHITINEYNTHNHLHISKDDLTQQQPPTHDLKE